MQSAGNLDINQDKVYPQKLRHTILPTTPSKSDHSFEIQSEATPPPLKYNQKVSSQRTGTAKLPNMKSEGDRNPIRPRALTNGYTMIPATGDRTGISANTQPMKRIPTTDPTRYSIHQSLVNIGQECDEVIKLMTEYQKITKLMNESSEFK